MFFWQKLKPYWEIYRLVWPLALGMANNAVMQFVDRVFLSRESAASLEAVLPASMLAILFIGFFQAIVMYSGTFVAQYHGAKDACGCRMSFLCGLALSVVSGLLLGALVPVGIHVFDWVGHAPAVVARERTYYSIVMAGGWALCATMAASGYFTGRSRTRLVFWVNLLGNALNILLDYLLIFGFSFNLPPFSFHLSPLGIAGAAGATVASQVVQMFILCTLAILDHQGVRKADLNGRFPELLKLMGRILRFGLPTGVHSVLNILSFTVFVFLTGKVGDLAFAVSNAAFTVNYLLYAPMEGFGIGAGILVGQHQGAGDSASAFRAGNRALVLGEIYIAVASVAVLVFYRPLLLLFASDTASLDPTAFCALGFTLFLMMVAWQFSDAAEVVMSGALKGAGDTRFVMTWMLIMAFPFWMPILFVTYHFCPTMQALWGTMLVYCVVFAIGTAIRWIWGPWRRIRLIG